MNSSAGRLYKEMVCVLASATIRSDDRDVAKQHTTTQQKVNQQPRESVMYESEQTKERKEEG